MHLLDGVTGSGKTEIYLRLIAACSPENGRQAIYLVPEIGLTNQLIERVRQRFGECFAIVALGSRPITSVIAPGSQFRCGEVGIMLGTRSSLFSQVRGLGLIVVDEEHDHPIARKTACATTRATSPSSARKCSAYPSCSVRRRPSLEAIANCTRDTWRVTDWIIARRHFHRRRSS